MNEDLEINRIRAVVLIEYSGSLGDLAKVIEEGLDIPAFRLESNMEPPHSITAMSECLGFELWLDNSTSVHGYAFVIEFQNTSVDVGLEFKSKQYDMSAWFSKYLALKCQLKTSLDHGVNS